ncbi:MAG: hypothetical protein KAJ42_09790, partial [Gemmatimonadetes bacterium]|nr:hypothetical protein [Gemmatimonadota bacterium]
MSIRLLSILVSLPLLTACDGILGLGEDKRVGVIAFYSDPVVITVPDSVQAGVSFEVSVLTYGGGCH